MPDKWGRITPQDWMGLGDMFKSHRDSRLKEQAYRSDIQTNQLQQQKLRKEIGAFDENNRLDQEAKRIQIEQQRALTKEQKAQFLHEATKRKREAASSHWDNHVAPLLPGVYKEDGTMDLDAYKRAVKSGLDTYDFVNDGFVVNKESLNWEEGTMQVKDAITGETFNMPIPTMENLRESAKILHDPQAVGHLTIMGAEKAKQWNNQQWNKGKFFANEAGDKIYVVPDMIDPLGLESGGDKPRRYKKQTRFFTPGGDQLTKEQVLKGGFMSADDLKKFEEVKTQRAKTKTEKATARAYGALQEQREASAGLNRARTGIYERGGGAKLTPKEKIRYERFEEELEQALSEKLIETDDPEYDTLVANIAKKWKVDHLIFSGRDKPAEGGSGGSDAPPPKVVDVIAPDGTRIGQKAPVGTRIPGPGGHTFEVGPDGKLKRVD